MPPSADWDATHLFVSDRLEAEEPALLAGLRAALAGTPVRVIPGTRDVWCRDYMPVQLGEDEFCQFVYRPDYLDGFESLVTPPARCRLPFMARYREEPIVLDGGNVVASRTKVILTDKVFRENPGVGRRQLRRREEVFRAECVVVPKEPYDPVGHADGVVRFVDEGRVLVNDPGTDPAYGSRLRTALARHGLTVETLPAFHEAGRSAGIPSAVGLYINFLRVGDVVVLPGYERPEDETAVDTLRRLLPHAVVSQLPCRSLAQKGGVLNCISWTIKGACG